MGVDRLNEGGMLMNEINSDDAIVVEDLIVDDDALELAAGGLVKPTNCIMPSETSSFVAPS